MKRILLMRHALADLAASDFDRPLLREGIEQVQDIIYQLQDILPQVDYVLCSPAHRTRQTLEGVQTALSEVPKIIERQIYHATMEELQQLLQLLDESVQFPLMIGHNPAMAHCVMQVTGNNDDFPPAGVALINTEKPWADFRLQDCQLSTFYYPRILKV